mgnify:FL=1
MGRQMPGSATEDGESLAGVLDSEPAIGEKEISEAMAVLEKYKSAKASSTSGSSTTRNGTSWATGSSTATG